MNQDRQRRRHGTHLWSLLLVAVVAALVHLAPFVRAAIQTPDRWVFTGNLSVSPDAMQYRVWMQQAAEGGPLVSNRLTGEPNPPHLLVVPYYLFAVTGRSLGISPEFAVIAVGAILGGLLTVMLFQTVRRFLPDGPPVWWTFGTLVVGGGLGGALRMLASVDFVSARPVLVRYLREPLDQGPVFEAFRGHYVFPTLFDAHFLLMWVLTLAAVWAIHAYVMHPGLVRSGILVGIVAVTSVAHIYEAVTLCAIGAGVALVGARAGLRRRECWRVLVLVALPAMTGALGQVLLYSRSGLPFPTWRGLNVLVAMLVVAFPVQWILLAHGWPRLWGAISRQETILVGWAAGCLGVALSGPFFPYPHRGILTLQVPLTILAGLVYFERRHRVPAVHVVIALALTMGTPALSVHRLLQASEFQSTKPYAFLGPDHQLILRTMRSTATESDLLLARGGDLLWLGPEFPGRLYLGHFFLTVDYERKRREVEQFFALPADLQRKFLDERSIRFVFVSVREQAEQMDRVAGLVAVVRTDVGVLYERRSR